MMFIVGFMKMADATRDALNAVSSAAQQTQTGKEIAGNAQKIVQKAQNIRLFGGGGSQATEGAVGAAAGASSAAAASPSLSIKDGKQLQLDYGRLSASMSPGSAKANMNLGRGLSAQVSGGSGETRAGMMFKKEF